MVQHFAEERYKHRIYTATTQAASRVVAAFEGGAFAATATVVACGVSSQSHRPRYGEICEFAILHVPGLGKAYVKELRKVAGPDGRANFHFKKGQKLPVLLACIAGRAVLGSLKTAYCLELRVAGEFMAPEREQVFDSLENFLDLIEVEEG